MSDYKFGFVSKLDQQSIPAGLNQKVIRQISQSKKEPKWVLDFRLKAFRFWQKSKQPNWAKLNIKPIDYQAISYFAAIKQQPKKPESLTSLKRKWLNSLEN
jgi:Fe-S cluster assembly protein SufB